MDNNESVKILSLLEEDEEKDDDVDTAFALLIRSHVCQWFVQEQE